MGVEVPGRTVGKCTCSVIDDLFLPDVLIPPVHLSIMKIDHLQRTFEDSKFISLFKSEIETTLNEHWQLDGENYV